MQLEQTMSNLDMAVLKSQTSSFNKALGDVADGDSLDRNDFLKILITQLTHQDPTDPMKDRDFIAQMAQFSTLEQMTNMSQDFQELAGVLSSGRAMALLGRTVDVLDGTNIVTGVVEEVAGRTAPRILVNGRYYDYENVEKVR